MRETMKRSILMIGSVVATFFASMAGAAPAWDTIEKLIAGPQPSEVNCVGTALLGAGLLNVPMALEPSLMDKMKDLCFQVVPAGTSGDIGVVLRNGRSVHFYTFLGNGKAFNRWSAGGKFEIVPEAEARTHYMGEREVWRFTNNPRCPLSLFQEKMNGSRPMARAALKLRSAAGLDSAMTLDQAEFQAMQVWTLENEGLIMKNEFFKNDIYQIMDPLFYLETKLFQFVTIFYGR
jgi:hypothetical protein